MDRVENRENENTQQESPCYQETYRPRRRNPELLAMLGVTEEEMSDPGRALTSAGVDKMFKILKAMEMPLEDEQGNFAGGGMSRPECVPVWQMISGLTRDTEKSMSPEVREERLQILVNVVLKFLRFEIDAERAKPSVFHTVFWDPLAKVCSALGIARAQLSRLTKEATGLAAHELVDGIRAESVKAKMRESILKVVELVRKGQEKEALTVREVWAALREARRGPQFHRGQWALGFGFSNYLRFYRACLFYYKLAPQQLELSVIEEVLGAKVCDEPAADTNKDGAENAHVDPFLRVMKGREVQFFTELGGFVWKEAVERVRAAG
jgi:AraC-like DNA-binding protein